MKKKKKKEKEKRKRKNKMTHIFQPIFIANYKQLRMIKETNEVANKKKIRGEKI